MAIVSVWIDSDPDNFAGSHALCLASAPLTESPDTPGRQALAETLCAELPSGLEVEVDCERNPSGELHCVVSHDGVLASVGTYAGPFSVRMYPPEDQSYVLEVKAAG
jgi:hypothetical protein